MSNIDVIIQEQITKIIEVETPKEISIIEVARGAIGPKGDRGDTGEKGDTGLQGPAGISDISLANDVDITNVSDGSVLSWSDINNKWIAQNKLDQVLIDGGNF